MWRPKAWRPKSENLLAFYAPLSKVSIPLINGLARGRLARDGVAQREARLNDMSINYYCKAPRPADEASLAIVLVHGIADNALTWSCVFSPLARTHTIYAIDLPGYGYSGLPAGHAYT